MENGNKMRLRQDPVPFPRTRRPDVAAMNTSARAGKVYPAAFIPLMPEDMVLRSNVSIMCRMEETEKLLANAVHFRAHAWFVSYAALERFDGLDSVAFAWAERDGASSIVDKYTYVDATHGAFYKAFGEHIKPSEEINSLYVEAYNQVINYRRNLVSISLENRLLNDHSLARALWGETAIARIVPDFDAALIEAELPLRVLDNGISLTGSPVLRGYRLNPGPMWSQGVTATGATDPTPSSNTADYASVSQQTGGTGAAPPYVSMEDVTAELEANGIVMSLAQIQAAEKTQAFALMRQQYAGNPDDLIDLFMRGLRFPSNVYTNPILMGSAKGVFGMNQRYATDSDNLEQYVVNGATRVDIPLAMPPQPTGGVIVITYEIIPEPVFDRQADMFLRDSFDDLPNALRDHLDTQPVSVVENRFVDALHTTPDGTFGYAPMNYEWVRRRVKVGGRFLRTLASDPSAEDQQHIWSVRQVDPVLNEDAFLVPADLAHNVFRDTELDPFIVQCVHNVMIEGITQFGPSLYESKGDYDAVAGVVPSDIIDPDE